MFSWRTFIARLFWLAFLAPVFSGLAGAESLVSPAASVAITAVQVDGQTQDFDRTLLGGKMGLLRLSAGTHDLAFRFGPTLETDEDCLRLRYRLDGVDTEWRETDAPGMRVVVRFQNAAQDFLDENEFYVLGFSEDWGGSLSNSMYCPRRERVVVPEGAVTMELLLVSGGTVDTLGALAIDDLTVSIARSQSAHKELWFSDDFENGSDLDRTGGTPADWHRGGLRRDILQVVRYGDAGTNHALAAVDTHLRSFGEWYRKVSLTNHASPGDALIVEWKQAYNVGYGKENKASYAFVQPGRYMFHVAGLSTPEGKMVAEVTLPVYVPPHFWGTLWFISSCSAGGAILVAVFVRYFTRRRMQFQMERLKWQQSLERERTRIARDIHDDLGAGLTRISMLSASARDQMSSVATGEMDEITETARELVGAMDEIVWAVNPRHDKLDSLIAYCGKYAQDFFKAAGIPCRLDLAYDVPDWTLTSQVRHNLFLAFKEALNNAARHAGARALVISAKIEAEVFVLSVQDNGRGFDVVQRRGGGNGLVNMRHRLSEIGGECVIESLAGKGTVIKFILKKLP